jgi:outer membrane lipoprotein-sorting protein
LLPNILKAGFLILVLLLSTASYGQQQVDVSAKEVIRKMDLILRGDSSFGLYQMSITDPDWQRTLTLKAWEKRKSHKTLIRILSPPKEEGIVTLKIMLEMWNYLPRVERIIKIPPSMMLQPWMGSDFTNDDLVKASSMVNDYTHKILAEEKLQGHDAYKVELLPKPDAPVVWGKIMAWVRKADSMPLRQEFFNEQGELIRVLVFSAIKEVRGRVIPTHWEMTPIKKKGRKTVMQVLDLQIDLPIEDSVFSLRNLKQVR